MMNATHIAAFFDIDGTLVPPPSLEKRFLRYLRWRGIIGWKNFARCAAPLIREAATTGHFACLIERCKSYLAGVPVAAMDGWLGWLARHPIELISEAQRCIEWHAQQGHQIFLLSGTLAPLACAVTRCISVPAEVRATQLEIEGSQFTGRIIGEAVCGAAKARTMRALAEEFSLDLAASYAYGDRSADRWMLASVGHPFVVRATNRVSWRLTGLARRKGYPILRWNTAHKSEHRDAEIAEARRGRRSIFAAQVKCR